MTTYAEYFSDPTRFVPDYEKSSSGTPLELWLSHVRYGVTGGTGRPVEGITYFGGSRWPSAETEVRATELWSRGWSVGRAVKHLLGVE